MEYAPITTIMSDEVITVSLDTDFVKLQELMKDFIIHHIPVVDDKNQLCGMVSRNDLLREYTRYLNDNAGTNSAPDLIASDVMVSDVTTINDSADIKEAAQIMIDREFHSVPVVDAQHHVVGIVTSTDLIEHLITLY